MVRTVKILRTYVGGEAMRVYLLWDENPMTRILEPTATMLVPIASKRGFQAPIQGKEVLPKKGIMERGMLYV